MKHSIILSMAVGGFFLNACAEEGTQTDENTGEEVKSTITYLGEEYDLDTPVDKIAIAGSMEALEDALILGYEPFAASTSGGEFAGHVDEILTHAEAVGEKTEPNVEQILELDPDLLLATTKFPDKMMEQLEKVTEVIQVSHIADDWQDNLRLFAELTDKEGEAEEAIEEYEKEIAKAMDTFASDFEDVTVLAVRIRGGEVNIYPEDIFLNPVLYGDLEFDVPDVVENVEAQQVISREGLIELDPDVLFVQFAGEENTEAADALEDFQNEPAFQNISAFENEDVYINSIPPMSEGGPAWSRLEFVQAINENLGENDNED
ncbi:ABC transporter substrate-binding protein [Salicibibacter cibi]|uniref:ABC transporter substrate-binding protein n=1 Tax=Salicibibacter cibi TaxID=2743001 RepID=A0A7T6ZDI6_9BACI|nr:ABC transporter substrate-binding protein [Salicibibacter cibi]QQK81511.1 ABC transporter substrate-binding protein [Salicibibacter cibi]